MHAFSAVGGRRRFIQALAGMIIAAKLPSRSDAKSARTRLILLGTGGGPRPRTGSVASAQVVIANGVAYVVDCGDGVARQLVSAGVSLERLRHVFITHHHSDHNADYGNLLLLAWASGLRTQVDTWGPPPIKRITQQFLAMNAVDIDTRIADEGLVPLAPLIDVHELTRAGFVMRDENVAISCACVEHPMMKAAFAYRFDAADRSIGISGDTRFSSNLIKLAEGADVLVHEAYYPAAVNRLAARVPNVPTLKKHILASHTSAEDCGRIAAAARVKTLVLSHFVPPDDPAVTPQMWIDDARIHFQGEVIVGRDLLEL